MKKTLFFSALVVLTAGLIFAGCKKDDKDEPSLDPHAAAIAGQYFWGYGEEGNVTNGGSNYCELAVDNSGLKAVLSAEGEAPLTLEFTFDKDGAVTVSTKDHDLFGKAKDIAVEVSEDGKTIKISGTSEYKEPRDRSGKYTLVLKQQSESMITTWEQKVMGKSFQATWDGKSGLRSQTRQIHGGADMMDLVFDKSEHTALLSTAGECPMTINWSVDQWNNFTLVPVDRTWKLGDGMKDGLIADETYYDESDYPIYASKYYGDFDYGYITIDGAFRIYFEMVEAGIVFK